MISPRPLICLAHAPKFFKTKPQFFCFFGPPPKKSCILETKNLSTDANSRTNTILERLRDFFFIQIGTTNRFYLYKLVQLIDFIFAYTWLFNFHTFARSNVCMFVCLFVSLDQNLVPTHLLRDK